MNRSSKSQKQGLKRAKRVLWCTSAAAGAAALLSAPAAFATTPVDSFETGGFDFDGDTGAGVTYTPMQTSGVTDGSKSLQVSSPQSWWVNFGYTNIPAADVAANSVLKFDITTSTGVNFIPIFHTDPSPNPGDGGYYQYGSGIYVGASASTQTVTIDYSTAQFNPWAPQTGLPAATTNNTFQ